MFSFLKKLFGKAETTTTVAEPLRGEWTSVEVKPTPVITEGTTKGGNNVVKSTKPKHPRPAKPKAQPKTNPGTQQHPKKAKPAKKPKVSK